ncbi:MAG: hypothetical protein EOO81_09275 [Oxalobacteraceae bacterium]|nr:MAG: hypothetical protein EOO81_09275 [Oxalobacteraceae bacterium]
MTELLQHSLLTQSIDHITFANKFADWKALGPDGEDAAYDFGKDGYYSAPLVDGNRVLRHVHLVPENDLDALARWNRDWERYSRRSSDTALVYAQDQLYGCLLIQVLWEPGAHEVSLMKTQQHRELMNGFAQVAEHFVHTGKSLI